MCNENITGYKLPMGTIENETIMILLYDIVFLNVFTSFFPLEKENIENE